MTRTISNRTPSSRPIDRMSGTAVWKQIVEILSDEIDGGVVKPGEKLPTEAVLSSRFDVNRHTVRRAISELVGRGLLDVRQGRGIFVRENVLDYMIGRRTRFTENVRKANREPGGELISVSRIEAPEIVAHRLRLEPGAMVIRHQSISNVDNRPISVGTHWFSADFFPDFETVLGETNSITKVMEHHGFGDYERAVTKVTARMPDSSHTSVLEAPKGRPLLYSETLNVSGDGKPLQYSEVFYVADRFQMVFESRSGFLDDFESL